MPKLKTKSGAKKRFKVTASGKVKFKKAFSRHMMMNKPKSMKRKARGTDTIFKADGERVTKCWMPNDRKRVRKASPTKAVRLARLAEKHGAAAKQKKAA